MHDLADHPRKRRHHRDVLAIVALVLVRVQLHDQEVPDSGLSNRRPARLMSPSRRQHRHRPLHLASSRGPQMGPSGLATDVVELALQDVLPVAGRAAVALVAGSMPHEDLARLAHVQELVKHLGAFHRCNRRKAPVDDLERHKVEEASADALAPFLVHGLLGLEVFLQVVLGLLGRVDHDALLVHPIVGEVHAVDAVLAGPTLAVGEVLIVSCTPDHPVRVHAVLLEAQGDPVVHVLIVELGRGAVGDVADLRERRDLLLQLRDQDVVVIVHYCGRVVHRVLGDSDVHVRHNPGAVRVSVLQVDRVPEPGLLLIADVDTVVQVRVDDHAKQRVRVRLVVAALVLKPDGERAVLREVLDAVHLASRKRAPGLGFVVIHPLHQVVVPLEVPP